MNTPEEIIKRILSDEGMNYSQSILNTHPHRRNINLPGIYANLVSVLRSFNCGIKVNPFFSMEKVLAEDSPVEVSSCVASDNIGYIQSILTMTASESEQLFEIFLFGRDVRHATPFERYQFAKMPDGNYYLKLCQTLDYKLKNGVPFSPKGSWGFSIHLDGDSMINDKPFDPKFTGINGLSKQWCIPIKVYVDKEGNEDEPA